MRLFALCTIALAIAIAPGRLRIEGTRFVGSENAAFQWRGITAFKLVEMVAHGREREAAAHLDWVAGRRLTVVRVFTMAHHLFKLSPADGVAALPRLLDLAAKRGLYVEVVALADTAEIPVDIDEHVAAIGRIAARHPNAFVEVANEPVHRTHKRDVHRPDVLRKAAATIPKDVPVSLGSIETGEGFAAGSYVTWHVARNTEASRWGHVLAIAEGETFVQRWKKPVISDEPIGAASRFIAGRRDDEPARFRAAALLTRLAGLGATFHYEGGLQAEVPRGRELQCFNAWNEAWRILPAGVEHRGVFALGGEATSVVNDYDKSAAAGVFERRSDRDAWVVAVGVEREPRVRLRAGWTVARSQQFAGIRVITARRSVR